ncbi:GIY-YIG nuclease family protein [Actinomycetospora sp. NBRC 106375]|uniref:GIY-YIG nuclease family protein n=1 Tax=Actinomycetospora sp. NBRC 106375 TaxID=3032207 RepID=UPI0025552596|nr:GIY-YIG nuclease family protein [Actinomycetospora sp. NBRC 106375]
MDFRDLATLGAEPTPRHLGQFIVQYLESHGPSKRGDFINAAETEWRAVSGRRLSVNLTSAVKKALSDLTKQDIVRPSGVHGIWVLTRDQHETGADDRDMELPGGDGSDAPQADCGDPGSLTVVVEKELGVGSHLVYSFYLDTYRVAAEAKSENRWPIKIGMTTGQLDKRMETHRTALPEVPRIPLVIRHENAALLERVVYGALMLRGRGLDGVVGSEWFLTTPEEIEEIYRSVAG